MKNDLTPREVHAALKELCASIGTRAEMHLGIYTNSLSKDEKPVWGVLQPSGYQPAGQEWDIRVEAETFGEAILTARAKYEEQRDARDKDIVHNMALAIISITIERDECTDAALRAAKGYNFDQVLIDRLGERACALANDMAGKGPFTIVSLGVRANGAPALVDPVEIPF